MQTLRRLQLALVFFALLVALAPRLQAQSTAPTTVIVVRHAEKLDASSDPALSPAGTARAEALATALANAGVTAIYTSQFRRTRDTAQPLATRLNVPVTVFEITQANGSSYPAALAADVLAKHRGGVIAVVSHSNTVPPIVKALSGKDVPAITDPEYDHLFIVTVPASGAARVIKTTYGAPTRPGQPIDPARMQQ